MAADGDYCAFTKAVEHLGDRWSLVIVRDLMLNGTQGFNALADGLPGISRSVLAARLRKLEDLGLVMRDPASRSGVPGYCLTPAGHALRPVLSGLREWSQRFVPEDPAMVERDPDIIPTWLSLRVDPSRVPTERVVLDMRIEGTNVKRAWLVLERDRDPSICIEDPCLAADRYVFLESDVPTLDPIARGIEGWTGAIADRSVRLYGEPELLRELPNWFRPASRSHASRVGAVSAR